MESSRVVVSNRDRRIRSRPAKDKYSKLLSVSLTVSEDEILTALTVLHNVNRSDLIRALIHRHWRMIQYGTFTGFGGKHAPM